MQVYAADLYGSDTIDRRLKNRIRRCWLLAGLLTCVVFSHADTYQWAWITGSPSAEYTGDYGDQGDPAQSNTPPGRGLAASWSNPAGQTWLYGGFSQTTASTPAVLKADLWKFDPVLAQWTWVSGTATSNQAAIHGIMGQEDPDSSPGGRAASATWLDSDANLWLFGGTRPGGANYNDLWKYNTQTDRWSWIDGSNIVNQAGIYGIKREAGNENIPPARDNAVTWMDSGGNFWLFGGTDYVGNFYNDLWKYSPLTQQWTWMAGSDTVNQLGVYGTQGQGSEETTPGGRGGAVSWRSLNGDLWLFGGRGRTGLGKGGMLNDVWKYGLVDGNWSWMDGSNSADPQGVYGTLGIPSGENTPSGRSDATGSEDGAGNLWLFGGTVPFGTESYSRHNDLWYYHPGSGMWTWVQGSDQPGQHSTIGTKGDPAPANTPGARAGGAGFVDGLNRFWMVGGLGFGIENELSTGFYSDVWNLQLVPEAYVDDWNLY